MGRSLYKNRQTREEFSSVSQRSKVAQACEMLIGGEDISNDVINLGTYSSVFVYIRPCFCFALIGGNLKAQSTGSHRGIGGAIQISET